MKKYSSKINKLYGYEPMTKYIAAGVVFLQLGTAYYLRDKAFTWEFWIIAYIVGEVANLYWPSLHFNA